MKTFRTLLLPFTVALLCAACGPKQPAPASSEAKREFPISIPLSGKAEYHHTLLLTDFAEDVEYIPLETKRECLLGRMDGLELTQDYIFVLTGGGTLLQFDRQGKYVRRINKQGKGPGECTARSFGIDEKHRLIYILDNKYLDIYTFTFEGKHVKTLRNPFANKPDVESPAKFMYDKLHGNFIFTSVMSRGDVPHKYVVTDPEGKMLYECPNYTQSTRLPIRFSIWSVPFLVSLDSSYYYGHEFNDTIFVIHKDYTCSPAYIRSLPNCWTLKEQIEVGAGVLDISTIIGRSFYKHCWSDRRYLYLIYDVLLDPDNSFPILALYDKQTGILLDNCDPRIVNNFDGGLNLSLRSGPLTNHYSPERNQYCQILDAYEMKETLTNEHFAGRDIAHPEKAEALKKLVSNLKEDDNPVLMIITMK